MKKNKRNEKENEERKKRLEDHSIPPFARRESVLSLDRLMQEKAAHRDVYDMPPNYMMLIPYQDAGFPFGKMKYQPNACVGKPQGRDGHILVSGCTGSGKSSCVANQALALWEGVIVAVDVNGRSWDRWNKLTTRNRCCKILNLTKNSWLNFGYDIFYLLRQSDEGEKVQYAREIAQAIIPLTPDDKNLFFTRSEQSTLTGLLIFFCDQGLDFTKTMSKITSTPLYKLLDDIADSENKVAQILVNEARDLKSERLHDIAVGMKERLLVFATDKQIRNSFIESKNSIKWEEDIKTHNVFICVAEDRLEQHGDAIALILTQLIRTSERRPDKYSPERQNMPPVLLLLDEFPRIGKIEVIRLTKSMARTRGR